MWIVFSLGSALCLGFYDVMKKLSVRGNNVLMVLMLNTVFSALLMVPFLAGNSGLSFTAEGHGLIALKAVIVLCSWLLGYFAIKHLPLTVQGPINASRPVMVLVGAVAIYGERLNLLQWAGITLGFVSLYLISRIGRSEARAGGSGRWVWMSVGAAALGAASGLYDKYLISRYDPMDVQGWYAIYQCLIMTLTIFLIRRAAPRESAARQRMEWRWSIPLISVFLTVADMAYFHALAEDGALVAIVSMIRRGSVVVPFVYGVTVLHEKNVKAKAMDLGLLLASLGLLVAGS